jgi:hypothetical protein
MNPSIFLAGSIEMDTARRWQDEFTQRLSDLGITVLNPRRSDWNSEWKQSIDCKPFKEQVDWEMDHLELADVIALYFDPDTMSPISLLELGLHAKDGKIIVCCPEGYWRRGNVKAVVEKYSLECVETLEDLIVACRARLQECIDKGSAASREV